jgi:GDP-L-fucose synthase
MDLRDKKILVTGARGFVGTAVVARLKARGVPASHIFTPAREAGDLRTAAVCEKAASGADVVIHLAGVTGGVTFHREHPGSIFYDNLIMGVRLMEAARRAGAQKFVTAGSMAEYPTAAPIPYKEKNLWDGYPDSVHAPYAVAKTMLMVQALSYRAEYGFNAVHLLLTSMYGPGEKDDFVIPSLIRRMREAARAGAPSVEVWGTGKPTRDFLYVEDAAEAIILAAERYDSGEPVNIGSGVETSIRDLAAAIARLTGFAGEVRFDAAKPDGSPRRVADVARARGFGFRAATDLESGLRATIAWHMERAKHEAQNSKF